MATPPKTPGQGSRALDPTQEQNYLIVSIALGIISLLFGINGFLKRDVTYIGFVTGIVGLLLSIYVGNRGHESSLRTAGMVSSVIGLVLSSVMLLLHVIQLIVVFLGIGYLYYYFM